MTRALLVMDFEPAILRPLGGDECPALANAVAAVEGARAAGVEVVFVRVAFRRGYPEANARNKAVSAVTHYGDALEETNPGTFVHSALSPKETEPIVVKRRFGAFASDLGAVLSGKGVDSLIMAGVSSSGVVLSTVRDAADRDYAITVLSDACADRDLEVHEVLMTKIFPVQADVVTTAEWVSSL